MSGAEPCPDASRLRLAADDPLDLDALGVASHAARCPVCGPRLAAARTEVRALGDALRAADGPPPGALARTLARLAAEPDDAPAAASQDPRSARAASDGKLPAARRGKTSRAGHRPPRDEGPARAALVALAVVIAGALVLLLGRRPPAPPTLEPTLEPTTEPTTVTAPRTPPRPRRPVATEPPRAPERAPATEAAPLPDRATEWGPEPAPGNDEPVVATTGTAPPPAPTEPATTTTTEAPAPALVDVRLRAGRLSRAGGAAFGVGDQVPPGTAVEAGVGGADLDVGGAVRVALAARGRVTVSAPAPDGPIEVALARGALAARSVHGAARAYAVVTPEGRALPVGTTFLVARTGERTRVTTLDGAVRLRAPDRQDGDEVVVHAGFEAEAAARRPPTLPRPAARVDAGWLPDDLRPARLEVPRLLVDLAFEAGADGVGRATWRAGGARGSRGCLVGVPDGGGVYARAVELERPGGQVFAIDPDALVEAVVRVDRPRADDVRPVRVALQVWDGSENRALLVDLPPGRFVPIGARLRDLTGPSGEARPPQKAGGRAESLAVFAGESDEEVLLLVDDLRVSR